MTVQVARIAATRLRKAPRPLRLCYAGQVLRVKGSHLRPERQFGQAGAELIGAPSASADAEIALLAASALGVLGVADLTLDLTIPTLVPSLTQALGFGLVHKEHFLLFLLPLLTAGLTTFYMFRMWFLTFTGQPRDEHVYEHAHESPQRRFSRRRENEPGNLSRRRAEQGRRLHDRLLHHETRHRNERS